MFRQISTCFVWREGGCWFCIIKATAEALFEEREKQMNVDRFTDIISYFNFRLGDGDIGINKQM